MNYTVIGQDGKTYGPVSATQVREWLAQSRLDSRTAVLVEGGTDWTFLGLLPEFATEFSTTPPVIAPLKPSTAHPTKTNPLATWGMICGLLSWTFCCCCIPFNLTGLVLSIIALVQINAKPEAQEGRAFAIAGIILSATNLLWCGGLTFFDVITNQPNFYFNLDQN